MTLKKCIAVLLCFTMLLPLGMPAFAADGGKEEEMKADLPYKVTVADSLESAFAEGENSLLLFVTGIGQSFRICLTRATSLRAPLSTARCRITKITRR